MQKMIVKKIYLSKKVYEFLEQLSLKRNCYINDIVIELIRTHLGIKAGIYQYHTKNIRKL